MPQPSRAQPHDVPQQQQQQRRRYELPLRNAAEHESQPPQGASVASSASASTHEGAFQVPLLNPAAFQVAPSSLATLFCAALFFGPSTQTLCGASAAAAACGASALPPAPTCAPAALAATAVAPAAHRESDVRLVLPEQLWRAWLREAYRAFLAQCEQRHQQQRQRTSPMDCRSESATHAHDVHTHALSQGRDREDCTPPAAPVPPAPAPPPPRATDAQTHAHAQARYQAFLDFVARRAGACGTHACSDLRAASCASAASQQQQQRHHPPQQQQQQPPQQQQHPPQQQQQLLALAPPAAGARRVSVGVCGWSRATRRVLRVLGDVLWRCCCSGACSCQALSARSRASPCAAAAAAAHPYALSLSHVYWKPECGALRWNRASAQLLHARGEGEAAEAAADTNACTGLPSSGSDSPPSASSAPASSSPWVWRGMREASATIPKVVYRMCIRMHNGKWTTFLSPLRSLRQVPVKTFLGDVKVS